MSRTAADIAAELARTREAMTATVDELTARLDPRVQAKKVVSESKEKAKQLVDDAKAGDNRARAILGAVGGFALLALVAKLRTRK